MGLDSDRVDLSVVLLYNIDRSWPEGEIKSAVDDAVHLCQLMQALGHPVEAVPVYDGELRALLAGFDPERHTVLNWCEGLPGVPRSYGQVAQMLEEMGFAYTGAPPVVLEVTEDKRRVKMLLEEAGVPTPAWRICETVEADDWTRFPAIVKPAWEHCSVGIGPESVVTSMGELRDRIAYVLDSLHEPALVEDFIDGREFHGVLWGDEEVAMLPPVEIDYAHFSDIHMRLCTYDTKNNPDSEQYQRFRTLLPAPLSPEELALLERTVVDAYKATGCRDYARLDVRLRDGVFHVLDVNPNCYMSEDCTFVRSAAEAGYSYAELGSRLINMAWRRKQRESARGARDRLYGT